MDHLNWRIRTKQNIAKCSCFSEANYFVRSLKYLRLPLTAVLHYPNTLNRLQEYQLKALHFRYGKDWPWKDTSCTSLKRENTGNNYSLLAWYNRQFFSQFPLLDCSRMFFHRLYGAVSCSKKKERTPTFFNEYSLFTVLKYRNFPEKGKHY